MWKTRNIRRRNKGKKTKRQDGGLLPFMGPSIEKIIDFAIKNDMDVTAYVEKKTGMLSKATIIFKVKFIKGKKVKFTDEETKLKEIDANITPDTEYTYVMKGSNVEVILKLTTKIIISIDKTSIAEIKAKMKIEEETKSQKMKEMTAKTNVAQAQKKEDDKKQKEEDDKKKKEEADQKKIEELKKKEESKYESHSEYIHWYFARDVTGPLPYSKHELNYLYYCIETYFPENSLTKDTVHTFVKEFEKYDSKSEEKEVKEMNKEDAILRLESGIKLFMMNDSKTKLQEMVKRLNADPDELDNYLTPKYSLNKQCSTLSSMTYNRYFCFMLESLKQYENVELVLLDEDNPDEKLKMSIFDFVENGARPKEMWKNKFEPTIKSKSYYGDITYVSKGTETNSLVGFACYSISHQLLKVSNIIWADNEKGKEPNLRNILYDKFKHYLSGGLYFGNTLKLFIPDELNEMVNANVYKKGETKDGFTMWDTIVPTKPSVIDNKIDAETNEKGIDLLKLLQKLQILLGIIKERPAPTKEQEPTETPIESTTPIVESSNDVDAVLPNEIKLDEVKQTGGADNALLDEIITKYPSMKGLKRMIDNLPEDIRQKYESEINTTLEKVKESNVEEKVLMNEPEFQEIQADLNAQTEATTTTETTTDGEPKTEEPKTDGATKETKEGDTPPSEETKPDETTEETKPDGDTPTTEETKPDGDTPTTEESKTDETKPDETKPDETKPDETKPDETKPDETKPDETKPDEPKPDEPKTEETKTKEGETKPDATIPLPTDTNVVTPPTETDGTKPEETSVTTDSTTTPTTSDEIKLKREDLKESPLLVQPTTGESGKYIFVPKDLVEKVIDFLLNNGCEVTTINLK